MITLQITRPDKPAQVRKFKDRREAAKYGVAYFLRDNGYAPPKVAAAIASYYQDNGHAEFREFTFTEPA